MKLLFAVFLCLATCRCSVGAAAIRLRDGNPKTVTIQHRTIGVIQASWSQHKTSNSVETHFLLTSLSKGKLFDITQQGSLWATSEAFPLDSKGDIGFLIVSLVGAKAMDAKVVAALSSGDVRQVAEWSGVEITTIHTAAGTVVKVRENEVPYGVPQFYAWDGKSMVNVSSGHPELYHKEVEDIEQTIKAADNYPAYYYAEECRDLAIALSYSRNEKKAEQWCEAVRTRLANGRYMSTGNDTVSKAQVDAILNEIRQRMRRAHERPTN